MVEISYSDEFRSTISKIKDSSLKDKIATQIKKIKINPEVGKPMRYDRKGTRELYVKPFRLAYSFIKEKDEVVILNIYHKKNQ